MVNKRDGGHWADETKKLPAHPIGWRGRLWARWRSPFRWLLWPWRISLARPWWMRLALEARRREKKSGTTLRAAPLLCVKLYVIIQNHSIWEEMNILQSRRIQRSHFSISQCRFFFRRSTLLYAHNVNKNRLAVGIPNNGVALPRRQHRPR